MISLKRNNEISYKTVKKIVFGHYLNPLGVMLK